MGLVLILAEADCITGDVGFGFCNNTPKETMQTLQQAKPVHTFIVMTHFLSTP